MTFMRRKFHWAISTLYQKRFLALKVWLHANDLRCSASAFLKGCQLAQTFLIIHKIFIAPRIFHCMNVKNKNKKDLHTNIVQKAHETYFPESANTVNISKEPHTFKQHVILASFILFFYQEVSWKVQTTSEAQMKVFFNWIWEISVPPLKSFNHQVFLGK